MNDTTSTMNSVTAAADLTDALKRAVLWVGPVLSVVVALKLSDDGSWIDPSARSAAIWTALALWSPLPISVASVLCGADRDRTLTDMRGVCGSLLRGVLLPFVLLNHSEVSVRRNAAAAFGGFAIAAAVVFGLGIL